MAVNKRAAGADKEQLAARYLVDNGYTVLERNFRNKTGEIDIIAKKDNYIVFVEVKYRSNNKYGYAVEAVNYRKKQIIMHVAQFYMATRYKSCDIPCRFDAPMHLFTGSIKYTGTQSAKYVIRHRPGLLVTSPSTLSKFLALVSPIPAIL
jgi:putative endonuclease